MAPKKSSHGPLVAILGGTALIVIGVCGGVVYLIGTGVRSVERMIEARRGPTEVIDEDFRVRLALPTDGDPGWELWGPELARTWSDEGIAMLRHPSCAAGLWVMPRSEESLEAELRSDRGEVVVTPHAPPRGASIAFATSPDDGSQTVAFEHAGTFFEVVGQEPCVSSFLAQLELLPGEPRPRWTTPPLERGSGRSYRVIDRVFESTATGLRVDASEPFAIDLDDLVRRYGGAELVVRHRNGARIAIDPYRRDPTREDLPSAHDERTITATWLGTPFQLGASEPQRAYWDGRLLHGDRAIGVSVYAPDRARAERALAELEARVSFLDDASLDALRAATAPPTDRRAGADWSLRDGVFREHPQLARPRAVLRVPPFADVFAGLELASRTHDAVEGRVLAIERRDLGVAARLTATPSSATLAREALEHAIDYDDAVVVLSREDDALDHASAELLLGAGPTEQRMTVFVRVLDGWAFVLEAWRSTREHPGTATFLASLVEGLAIEPTGDTSVPPSGRHEDARLGFALSGTPHVSEPPDAVIDAEAGAVASSTSASREVVTVIAASDPHVASTLGAALDTIAIDRSVAALWARPAESATLDGRPATLRVLGDGGLETRVLETRIDRTIYVVVVRGTRSTDWQGALGRVDLDP